MKYLFYIFIFLATFSSCSVSRVENKANSTIDSLKINRHLLTQIDSFIKSHPNIKSIVILTDVNVDFKGEEDGRHHYLIIAPAYKDISSITGNNPSFYFNYKNAHVFIQSSLDGLINTSKADELYNRLCIKRNYKKEYRMMEEIFFEDAFMLNKIDYDSIVYISNEVDTFIKKRRVTFCAPPLKIHGKRIR